MSSQQPKPGILTLPPQHPNPPSDDFQVLAGFTNALPLPDGSYAKPPTNNAHAPTPQPSRTPTGLGAEPLNIIILGASFAGLACAHHFLDHTLPRLHQSPPAAAPRYRLVLVSPSTHFYWNLGAPRALVAPDLISQEDAFVPLEPAFHRHRGHQFSIIQGTCTAMSTEARTVTLELIGTQAQTRCSQLSKRVSAVSPAATPDLPTVPDAKTQTLPYHALILATGSAAHSDLLGLHGPHPHTLGALSACHARVAAAQNLVVCGGGPSGVETAGQLAQYLNYTGSWPWRRRAREPKRIVLFTGAARCLPGLKGQLGRKAEAMLTGLGVEVRHDVRVVEIREGFDPAGQTEVLLSDGTRVVADLYLACTGVEPNSSFVPARLRDGKGFVRGNGGTTRVDLAGERVYAVGDVAAWSRKCVGDVYGAVPVLMGNLLKDLRGFERGLASPEGGEKVMEGWEDGVFVPRRGESVLCPITRFGGVGVWKGQVIPGFLVYLLKGHDYRVCKKNLVVVNGTSPYG
ncbi:hypothetical protein B0A54_07688 [Friedmanniomyces endolithicus]|uniref:FAD/NAD(P)-binding domain-containing protein n=1 Tax=Friedmanniomyces endolithicus TaxID=329885 RepID=A0A4U0V0L6_9PEZI|nr:hypothetical protein LTS09_001180 [Friedmanniomyces endolithicus]TKA41166.1 hypothetical protein B0A54_07688 [Friedmanniomyces endolithicus]